MEVYTIEERVIQAAEARGETLDTAGAIERVDIWRSRVDRGENPLTILAVEGIPADYLMDLVPERYLMS